MTVEFTDIDSDAFSATVDWGDGTSDSLASVTSPFTASHSYAHAGSYPVTVVVSDGDGGVSAPATGTAVVNYTVVGGGFSGPLEDDGTTPVFKHGRTIPVQLTLADCDGSTPAAADRPDDLDRLRPPEVARVGRLAVIVAHSRAMDADRTAELVARDLRHVWHPFTQQQAWPADDPLVIERGDGMYLVAVDGRRYLDGVSSLWVTVHGHRMPEIDEAVRRQLDTLAHSTFLGLTHEPAIALAEELVATAPAGLTRVFYAGDGSSAVEAALKMAYQSAAQRGQSRPLYVHVEHGYHGDTLGAVSVGGIELFHATYRPILLETRQVSSPGARTAGQHAGDRAAQVVAELDTLLEREGQLVSAVIVEPLVQAAGGMLTHDPAFLRGVRAACDRAGALMIADEVATGIGRTGTMWACEQAGVAPDLLTCGKGLSAGYLPIAAVLATETVYEAFLGRYDEFRTFFHGHSYTANPLACAAARANLRLMRDRGTVAHARWVGDQLTDLLKPLLDEPGVVEIRQAGTMTGIELARPDGSAFGSALRTGFEVCRRARDRGVIIRPLGDVVVLMPPLAIEYDDLRLLADVTVEAVRDVLAERL